MAEAAIAYASNYLEGDKFRIRRGMVEAMRDGKWHIVSHAQHCAEKWHALNPPEKN